MNCELRGRWDEQRVQQLLSNLVSNALKYGAPGTPVRVTAAAADADVLVEVGNRGPALERHTLERIFDPLQRGADRPQRPGDDAGLGLGLYIASEIARAHHGRIDARSDRTETVFAVRLPKHV